LSWSRRHCKTKKKKTKTKTKTKTKKKKTKTKTKKKKMKKKKKKQLCIGRINFPDKMVRLAKCKIAGVSDNRPSASPDLEASQISDG